MRPLHTSPRDSANRPRSVPDPHATLRRLKTRFDSWRGHRLDESLRVCRAHGGLLNRKAGFDSRAGDPENISPRGVPEQHTTLRRSRTRFNSWRGHGESLTLEPDGKATGCNPVQVGSTPTGVSPQFKSLRRPAAAGLCDPVAFFAGESDV